MIFYIDHKGKNYLVGNKGELLINCARCQGTSFVQTPKYFLNPGKYKCEHCSNQLMRPISINMPEVSNKSFWGKVLDLLKALKN